jgi:hypothetical protein
MNGPFILMEFSSELVCKGNFARAERAQNYLFKPLFKRHLSVALISPVALRGKDLLIARTSTPAFGC